MGPGNAPVLISADADLGHAARSAVLSKSFDNGLICGAENNLVVEAGVRASLIAELERHGAAVLTPEETARFLGEAVDPQTGQFKPGIIGRDAATLAELAQIQRRHPIQLLVIPTDLVAAENCLAAEKLAPVLSLFTVAEADEGLRVCRALLDIDGSGHTAIIHARVWRRSAWTSSSRILRWRRPQTRSVADNGRGTSAMILPRSPIRVVIIGLNFFTPTVNSSAVAAP
ncbi:MAG TPA: hypothetical protein VGJ87_17205 [Roseiflexaceae bacterium]